MSPVNGSSRSPFKRIGLSEYTSQRLAELKARRAEVDEEMKTNSSSKARSTEGASAFECDAADVNIDHGRSAVHLESSDGDQTCPSADDGSQCPDGFQSPPSPLVTGDALPVEGTNHPAGDQTANDSCQSHCAEQATSETNRDESAELTPVSSETNQVAVAHNLPSDSSEEAEIDISHFQHLFQTSSHFQTNSSSSVNGYNQKENMAHDGDYVGFASLPDQVHRKAVKKGFDFTLMVVGESGLGKSTLISCLFQDAGMYKDRVLSSTHELIDKTVSIEKKVLEIEEKGVRLRLTVIDTPGFNDSLDNGESIRQTEVTLMKELQSRVNLIPIIAKADTLTTSEIKKLKEKILEDARKHDIKMYELPECDSDEDEDFLRQDRELKAAIPFAVVGSNTVLEIGGRKVRGRMYPWGVVDVDDPRHCDFSKLRQFLIGTHTQDLKDVTQEVHYENYRAKHLQEQMSTTQKDRKLKRHSSSIQVPEKIVDADYLIRQKEEEIERMKEMLKDMQNKLAVSSRVAPSQL